MNKKCIDIWYGEIIHKNHNVHEYRSLLNADERKQAEVIKREKLQIKYILVRGILRKILANYLQAQPDEIKFSKSTYGKPFLLQANDIEFNLSHSGNRLLIAVGLDCALGVDIEIYQYNRKINNIASRCLAESEYHYWQKLPEKEKIPAFYRIWTKKEAFVKATGRGIALGLNQCIISLQEPSLFLSVPDLYKPVTDWECFVLELEAEVCGCLVVKGEQFKYKMHDF